MKKTGYYIFRVKAWFISLLPFGLLYFLSDILFFLVYHVIHYRRGVVATNLARSFPDKTIVERKKIERQFYRNLCDLIVEFVKIQHITPNEVNERVVVSNPELIQELFKSQKSVFCTCGHNGNWEWVAKRLSGMSDHRIFAIYKELNNSEFNQYMLMNRTRFGSPEMIESKTAYRSLVQAKNSVNVVFLAGDQTPGGSETDYWTSFLQQDTPFFNGIEKMSKSLDYAVLFYEIQRVKRGYYQIVIHPVSLDPKQTKTGEITQKYVQLLEKTIINQPDNWLWSHRRWKHKREGASSR